MTPPTHGGTEDSVRLLLTKNPARFFSCPSCQVRGYSLESSRGPGRQLARYRAPLTVLTALRAVDTGLDLIGFRRHWKAWASWIFFSITIVVPWRELFNFMVHHCILKPFLQNQSIYFKKASYRHFWIVKEWSYSPTRYNNCESTAVAHSKA